LIIEQTYLNDNFFRFRMVMTVVEILNYWNYVGVFSYVLPFLLIFAVVFALIEKGGFLGNNNRAINTIVAAAIGLLALQFDMVPMFFAQIFPKLGIFIAVILAIMILLSFTGANAEGWVKWIGVVAAVVVVWWAFSDFMWFGGVFGGGGGIGWYNDYLWSLAILAAVIAAIVWVSKSGSSGGGAPAKG
jgi:hypothetical protein